VGHEIWERLLRSTLPLRLADGHFDLVANVRQAAAMLEVRERVKGLIEGAQAPEILVRVRRRARDVLAERRDLIENLIEQLIHVEGEWQVRIDDQDSAFVPGEQRVGVEAWLHAEAEGLASFLWKNIEVPFKLDRRAGAVLHLRNLRYDPGRKAVVGELGDLVVDLGEHVLLQLLGQVLQAVLDRQLQRMNPLEVLKREQVEQLASPLGGPFKVEMGVEDLELEVNDQDVTLRVRFGFTQKQIGTDDTSA
jgi:hypothetical protein